MPTQPILVLGAGELGTAVIKALTSHPNYQSHSNNVTVLLRPTTLTSTDPTKQKETSYLSSLGVSFEAGDIGSSSVSELAVIFKKYHTIISCAGMYLPSGTQTKLTRAVLEAGVARYFPWQYGIDYDVVGAGSAQDLFDEQLEVRSLLRSQSAVDWVVVSTGLFMSFLFVPGFGPVDLGNRVLRALGSWDTAVSVTTPGDIGRVVADIVYDPRGVGRQVVFVAGDTVTYGMAAELVEKRFGGEWKKEVWDRPFLRRRLEEEPGDGMLKYQNVFAAGNGVSWKREETLNHQRGIKMEDLETYLKHMVI
ncbi:hypothetical protein TruAng_010706 [Truncatella angustata]|nr:hypothetical protein TruAng_010706 [Truncatella angustata]